MSTKKVNSLVDETCISKLIGMTKMNDTRRLRLKKWFEGSPLPTKEKSYLSQLMTDPMKSFGEKAARRLEFAYGMPEGYLDLPIEVDDPELLNRPTHGLISKAMQQQIVDSHQVYAKVPLLSAVGSMGDGCDLHYEADQIIDSLPVKKEWIYSTLKCRPEVLRVITGAGDSMAPTFHDGDLLLVDTSSKNIDIDGVYAMSAHGRLFIKRVRQRITGEFEISSDNPTVKTVDVLSGDNEVTIHGRVVWAWNGAKL